MRLLLQQQDAWRFTLTQFLAEDVYFPTFLDWIETSAGSEDQHAQALEDNNE